ncbi:MAG: TRAP transporter small permease [Alphaproteobacteria bacterium]|nr:TRAP transporter small permease [Alphaproteobacteria bacterium]
MRRALDSLYRLSGAVAAAFLLAICGVVLLQVGANIINSAATLIAGEPVGLAIPSYSEFTGYFLVAASFLALAPALRAGSHIRVSLLIRSLSSGPRRMVELWCSGFGALFSGYFTWFAIDMVMDSYRFNDVSPGIIAVPIWIPQSAMAVGLVILVIALADEFVILILGGEPEYEKAGKKALVDLVPDDI